MHQIILTIVLICTNSVSFSNPLHAETPVIIQNNEEIASSVNNNDFEFPSTDKAWLRAAPANVSMLAAYVSLENTTQKPLKLVGAYSPAFKMAEIHKSYVDNGVAKMRHQKEVSLEVGEQLLMAPGGFHIMLMRPVRDIKEGDNVLICLIYEEMTDGKKRQHVQHIDFPVKNATDMLKE